MCARNVSFRLTWKAACLSIAVAAMLLPAAAQSTSTPPTAQSTATPSAAQPPQTVHQRKLNQENRIANGVQNGGLTAGETAKLENKEANLTKEKQQMRSADGGHLTSADQHALHQQQDKLSKQVYKDKHNSDRQKP
jgi:Skp family chaperone for outer membrane proteins